MIAVNRHVGTLKIDLSLPRAEFGQSFSPLGTVLSQAVNCRDCIFPWVC